MYIAPINNQNFEAKKFRLPTRYEIYDGVEKHLKGKNSEIKYVREYSLPNAETLYKEGKKAKDVRKMLNCYKQMGNYELKEMTTWEKVKDYLTEIFEKYIG